MIISAAVENQLSDFKLLMKRTDEVLNNKAIEFKNYFKNRGGILLEEDVFDAMNFCARQTSFENKIKLVSGASFPDILANGLFGVEVKSTVKNHWQTIGSSILESTRDPNVERIFLTFGKLSTPAEFISLPYEDCLSDIVVTHYPRYKIDMKLKENGKKNIFEKMSISYDELRTSSDIVTKVSNYYKTQLKPGESLWWANNNLDSAVPMTVKMWSSLSLQEKEDVLSECYILFPEILGASSNNKYSRCALWLATQKGVVTTSLRDNFSAGGQVLLENFTYKVPAVIGRVKQYKNIIVRKIYSIDKALLEEYWQNPVENNRIKQWITKIISHYSEPKSSQLRNILGVIFDIN